MSNKIKLRKQIIDYLCGEDDISPRFLKLLEAGGMGKEDGLIIKDMLMEHLNGISDLDLWFNEYYFYQYRWCHGLVKAIDIRANEGLEAAKNFVEPTPDGLYTMDDYPSEELKEYRNSDEYLELISKQFPQTVEEAVEEIVSIMDEKQIENVLNCSKQEFISNNHFGIGLFLRNNYGAYNKKGISLRADIARKGGPTFPADSMSGYLVGELWEYVNSKFQGNE